MNLITAQQLLSFAEEIPKGQGMDGFSLLDLRLISLRASQHIADLLNLIESGEDWPQLMLHGNI